MTSLHQAVLLNRKDAFELLVKMGANPTIPDSDGESVI